MLFDLRRKSRSRLPKHRELNQPAATCSQKYHPKKGEPGNRKTCATETMMNERSFESKRGVRLNLTLVLIVSQSHSAEPYVLRLFPRDFAGFLILRRPLSNKASRQNAPAAAVYVRIETFMPAVWILTISATKCAGAVSIAVGNGIEIKSNGLQTQTQATFIQHGLGDAGTNP